MLSAEITFDSIELSSQLVRDLINQKDSALTFVDLPFSQEQVPDQIAKKDFKEESRSVLVTALSGQYEGIEAGEKVEANIKRLADSNCYTVCTGHQLNLLSGPLYSIYKISQTIALARQLNEMHGEYQFVPVFWMASEDHDFAEINHVHFFGKSFGWDKDSEDKVVGRLDLEGCENFLAQVEGLYQNPEMQSKLETYLTPYKQSSSLAEASRRFIHGLFASEGLVIVDGDDPSLKAQMKDAWKKEILDQLVHAEVTKTNEKLDKAGYHRQVHLRESNLFFIDDKGVRKRIVKTEDGFEIGGKPYSKEELLKIAEENPEFLSPNALMRPLYQETILPNLVYSGGGGEIAYWMQLKEMFAAFGITFPMIRCRDSYILLNDKDLELMSDRSLSFADLKKEMGVIEKELVKDEMSTELNLDEENELFIQLKNKLKEHSDRINPGISSSVEADLTKMEKAISSIENKLVKAEKQKHESSFKKVEKLQQKIYPNRGFQERFENIIPYLISSPNIIKELVDIKLGNEPVIKILNLHN